MMQKSIRVRLLDREYTLRVRDSQESQTRMIAEYVDGKMQAFRDAHPDQADTTAAVITALAIAEELFLERARRDETRESLDGDLDRLEKSLADALVAR